MMKGKEGLWSTQGLSNIPNTVKEKKLNGWNMKKYINELNQIYASRISIFLSLEY